MAGGEQRSTPSRAQSFIFAQSWNSALRRHLPVAGSAGSSAWLLFLTNPASLSKLRYDPALGESSRPFDEPLRNSARWKGTATGFAAHPAYSLPKHLLIF